MAKSLITDTFWELIQPLLPPRPPRPKGGRPPIPDRLALTAIAFVLKSGIAWEDLPQEMGCGCGMTAWRRLRDWTLAGVWDKIHRLLLGHLRGAGVLEMGRAVVDSASVRAVFGGRRPGRTPPTAAKRAVSTMSSSTSAASRWPARSPGPTPTT